MSLWSKLFGTKAAVARERRFEMQPAPRVPQEDLDRVAISLLQPQLERLGLAPGSVPAEGGTFSPRSRGYVSGMGCGVAGRLTHNSHQMIETAEAAFAYVWGPEHAGDALRTLEEARADDFPVLGAIHRGTEHVEALLDGKPGAEAMGFWLLNNGENDPIAVMPDYQVPGPIPTLA